MPSFDITAETNLQEVDNAINSAMREVQTRYDFKGSKAIVTRDENTLTLLADDSMQHKSLVEMLKGHLSKRQVDVRSLEFLKLEDASGGSIRQKINLKQGIEQEDAKKITKGIKESSMKVQASIQGDKVRVTGKNRDDLQQAIQFIRSLELPLPLEFGNFRD